MKRVCALLLAGFLLLTLPGCGEAPTEDTGYSTEETGDTTETTGETTETTEETTEETGQSEPLETTVCGHDFQRTDLKKATCTDAGHQEFTCARCGDVAYEPIPEKGHSYRASDCLTPQTCTECGHIEADALGHSYGADHLCIRCGIQNPDTLPVEITATVRSNEGKPISGVTVTVYTQESAEIAVGSGITDQKGTANRALPVGSSKYTVVLSNVPQGFEYKESYSFSGTRITLNLKPLPVRTDPDDHTYARYEAGDKMMEFTVTDIDGNTYQLSRLLQEKKLVILDFWYVNCNPCKQEFPYFQAALETYGEDIVLLAVDPLDSAGDIRNLRNELGISFPLLQDPLGLSGGFRVESYPTTVFIDSTGTIRKIHRQAFADEAAFLRAVAAYL